MSEANELYRILGFDQSGPWTTISWLILGGSPHEDRECCTECGSSLSDRGAVYLEGYDEYAVGETRARAFWPNDSEMISLAPYIDEIASALTGVRALPVFYSDWNQAVLPRWRLRLKKPRLAALGIVGRAIGAYHPVLGSLRRCIGCESVPVEEWVRAQRHELLPFAATWDGTDLFEIKGAHDRFITFRGVSKLRDLGFTNLKLSKVEWAEAAGYRPPN